MGDGFDCSIRVSQLAMETGTEDVWSTIATALVRHPDNDLVSGFLLERVKSSRHNLTNYYQSLNCLEILGRRRFFVVSMHSTGADPVKALQSRCPKANGLNTCAVAGLSANWPQIPNLKIALRMRSLTHPPQYAHLPQCSSRNKRVFPKLEVAQYDSSRTKLS
jgi:hypothetical protein